VKRGIGLQDKCHLSSRHSFLLLFIVDIVLRLISQNKMRKFLKGVAKELENAAAAANQGAYGYGAPAGAGAGSTSGSLTGLNLRSAFGLSGLGSMNSVDGMLLALMDPTGMLANWTHRCPRQHPQPGQTDWYGLAAPHNAYFPNFFLCPDCYNALVRLTPYASSFVRRNTLPNALPHPSTPIRCDLSRYWVRVVGTLLLMMNPGHDITILARLASLRAADGPCPNAGVQGEEQELPRVDPSQPRGWYTVWDIRTGTTPIPDWRVCAECVIMMQAIWPALAQAWVPAPPMAPPPGGWCCGIVPSDWYDDVRTAEILKVAGSCGKDASKSGRPDLGKLVDWLRKNPPQPRGTFAGIQQGGGVMLSQPPPPNGLCPRNWPSTNLKCHTMQGVWEFTVCEQCYAEVIRPDAERGVGLAMYFDGNAALVHSGFTCQLYSERMRQVWREAAAANNVEYLRQKVSCSHGRTSSFSGALTRRDLGE
jgi:hypothetical protein